MRTDIFNPDNLSIILRTDKHRSKITLNLLDLRLPAGTEVEAEETSSYGLTPMYYANDCCMVSAVYLAQIVQETLRTNYCEHLYECHIYTAYTILPCPEVEHYWRKRSIHVHSAHIPTDRHRCHQEEFAHLYRCAEHAIKDFMRDLQQQTYNPNAHVTSYSIPYALTDDYQQADARQQDSLDAVWARLRDMSNPDTLVGLRELNKMVGMAQYKAYLHQLICDTQLQRMREIMGLRPEPKTPMHFVFTGNPGTGKTTAAKALGTTLREAGIISRGGVIYRDRSTLLGAHVGETENMLKELFEKEAPGNVVVIDEAYTLTADSWSGDFGHRVIDCLMTYTADPKADYVVVLCGYPAEMDKMLAANTGLSSRFALRFDFADFSLDELLLITHRSLAEMDYHFSPEAETAYTAVLREVLSLHRPSFGNARWVEAALHRHILVAQHRRLTKCLMRGASQLSRSLFTTIEQADILAVTEDLRQLNASVQPRFTAQRRIGFAA